MNTSNKATFKANLKTIARTGETLKVAIQNACIQAVAHYATQADTGYLNQLMDTAKGNRGVKTLTLQKFIQEHANVKYSKIKNAKGEVEEVFKKKTGKGGAVVTSEITTQWYDFSKDGDAVASPDFISQAKSLLKRATTNEKPLKAGTEEGTESLVTVLSEWIAKQEKTKTVVVDVALAAKA